MDKPASQQKLKTEGLEDTLTREGFVALYGTPVPPRVITSAPLAKFGVTSSYARQSGR